MKAVPFRSSEVSRGDLLCLSSDPTRRLLFKFMGHNGSVVATWLERPVGRPADENLRQREVSRLIAS